MRLGCAQRGCGDRFPRLVAGQGSAGTGRPGDHLRNRPPQSDFVAWRWAFAQCLLRGGRSAPGRGCGVGSRWRGTPRETVYGSARLPATVSLGGGHARSGQEAAGRGCQSPVARFDHDQETPPARHRIPLRADAVSAPARSGDRCRLDRCARLPRLRCPGRPSKSVSDALRWEIAHGGVRRLARARYGPAAMPRATEFRIHRRVLALRAEAAVLAGPDDAFWDALGA